MPLSIRHLWQRYLGLTPKQLVIAYGLTLVLTNILIYSLLFLFYSSLFQKIFLHWSWPINNSNLMDYKELIMDLISLLPQVFAVRFLMLSQTVRMKLLAILLIILALPTVFVSILYAFPLFFLAIDCLLFDQCPFKASH